MKNTVIKLAYCPFLSPKEKCQLFTELHPNHELFDWYKNIKVDQVNRKKWENYQANVLIEDLYQSLDKQKVGILTIVDQNYPNLLKNIYSPPLLLFYRGNIDLLSTKLLSVIGSRKTSIYGREATSQLLPELTKTHTIVSGLASGIDSLAHEIAIKENGLTIAVIGTGLDIAYPSENQALQEYISHHHLLLSEYPPNTSPSRENFPERNRIIAGLSRGVLIMEGKKRSGTLITARIAMEEGREVFCVPGPITQAHSEGVHELIKLGAKLVTNPADIYQTFEF